MTPIAHPGPHWSEQGNEEFQRILQALIAVTNFVGLLSTSNYEALA
jgi:hypothetical protein